ncbi:MAG TPA: twin-arginine translocation signal domain-containing protein [Noviherbaspirillum sp.]|uniref:twin-arginine translocation signal domain-containing protein n=1 Tax=Noviherbaspirillum sp. TaxID=1926288 RepID=UPI002B474778|nr:twin-arginine translocation signal domain-containing protein [Noviherbaspirillum sp.]HJV84068.1 twin-arginine translocation signal domain-containing protein [Noviherbaspirillum sp.]
MSRIDKNGEGEDTVSTMRLVDKARRISRRGFLKGSGMASIGITVMPATALLTSSGDAFAESLTTLGPDAAKDLLKMARDIFPHDKLAEKYYMHAIEPYDAAAKDPATKKLLADGITLLNATAQRMHGAAYVRIPEEEKRVAVLKAIETSPFFQKIRGDLVTRIYDNKELYSFFGYEGSSWEKGGYAKRGFNDIDWL